MPLIDLTQCDGCIFVSDNDIEVRNLTECGSGIKDESIRRQHLISTIVIIPLTNIALSNFID